MTFELYLLSTVETWMFSLPAKSATISISFKALFVMLNTNWNPPSFYNYENPVLGEEFLVAYTSLSALNPGG